MPLPLSTFQANISSAGIDSRSASLAHASSAKAMKNWRWVAVRFSSSRSPKSLIHATTRHPGILFDNHTEPAFGLASAMSITYFRKTPNATSYAQKPLPANSTNFVFDTVDLESRCYSSPIRILCHKEGATSSRLPARYQCYQSLQSSYVKGTYPPTVLAPETLHVRSALICQL